MRDGSDVLRHICQYFGAAPSGHTCILYRGALHRGGGKGNVICIACSIFNFGHCSAEFLSSAAAFQSAKQGGAEVPFHKVPSWQ